MPSPRLLSEIAKDYVRSEITALWVHERATDRHLLAFAVAEMCPAEQARSVPFTATPKQGAPSPMVRKDLGTGRTAYVARLFLDSAQAAVDFYRGQSGGGGWPLPEPLATVRLETPAPLTEEPPNETPLLLSAARREDDHFGAVFPRRTSSLRVCSRLDRGGTVEEQLTDKELDSLNLFSVEMLGVDLLRFPEHLGAIHLCFANPLLRGMHERLTSTERQLMVEFLERDGRSIKGCTLELTDRRPAGTGFHLRLTVEKPHLIVALPNSPEVLRTQLFDRFGDCIEEQEAGFIRSISPRVGIMGTRRRLRIQNKADGSVEEHDIQTVAYEPGRQSAPEEDTLSERLRSAQQRRELDLLAKNHSFIYFEGGRDSRERAQATLRELVGKALNRCLIYDPYLSAMDVVQLVPFIQTQQLPIRLLGARRFLKDKVQKGSEQTQGDALLECLRALTDQDRTLNIACRVMRGSQNSPVHDRFLVIDQEVYLLGSSLNEFGSRITTLFRVPDPKKLIVEAEEWWSDPALSVPIEELRASDSTPAES